MARFIGRLIWVPLSALIALAVSVFVLITLGLERFVEDRALRDGSSVFDDERLDQLMGWFDQGTFLMTSLSGLSLLFPVLLIIIGEVGKVRSALFYVLGGGVVAIAGPLLSRVMAENVEAFTMPGNTFFSVLATAGFVGGFVYWLLAGRSAS